MRSSLAIFASLVVVLGAMTAVAGIARTAADVINAAGAP